MQGPLKIIGTPRSKCHQCTTVECASCGPSELENKAPARISRRDLGCPLLGFISDRLGRRKPVIMGDSAVLPACLAWILFGSAGVFPPYTLGLIAEIASGAAMLPYAVIEEANPPQFGGTSTGVITFLNFTLTGSDRFSPGCFISHLGAQVKWS